MVVDEFYSACRAPGGVFKTFRDGVWCTSKSGKTVKILDPTTNEDAYEVQGAFEAAIKPLAPPTGPRARSRPPGSAAAAARSPPGHPIAHRPPAPPLTSTACSQAEVDAAFAGAAAAQKLWAKVPLWKRAEVLKRAAAELRAHAPALAETIRTEVAKPAADALAEVVRSAEFLEYTAEEGLRVLGEGRLQVRAAASVFDR
jgi:glyceraldehyde-3-phosphate dehydrogenase (NADP+)